MASELDRRLDSAVAALTGGGGALAVAAADGGDRLVAGAVVAAAAPATLPAFFAHFCALHADKIALVAGAERLSFTELGARSDAVAAALAGGWGIAKGDRVAIAMRNCPSWIVVYMGVVKAGGVATLINGWWTPHELALALALAEPALVIADDERARRIAEAGHDGARVILPIDADLVEALAPLLDGIAAGPLPAVAPDDDATILFTSGSTGAAKGAVSTHRAVTTGAYTFLTYSAALRAIMVADGRPPSHPPATLLAVPLFHVTGAVPVMLNSFAIGRRVVMMRKWDAGTALQLIEAERITYFVGVPTMGLELMQHPECGRRDTSSLLDLTAGGAPRPAAHIPRLIAAFPGTAPMIGYGLTETNATGCTNFRGNYVAKPESTGRGQAPFVDIAIFDGDGARLERGRVGEIGIRTIANVRGYWRDPEATAAAFFGAYFRTGDIGYLDAAGYLFIIDRAKDIIIRGGENISCQEVEGELYAHPAVAEACVFGLADDRLGEVPAAVVHLAAAASLSGDALSLFLGRTLARYKLPARIWISADPLPKLGTGKIDKVALRARYRAVVADAVAGR